MDKICALRDNFYKIFYSLFLLLLSISANSTSGSFDFGSGIISKGSAGVAVAMPQDALVSSVNPAGIAFVCLNDESGTCNMPGRSDIGLIAFSPRRGFNATNPVGFGPIPGSYKSAGEWFLLPSFGVSKSPSNNRFAYSFSLYGNGGMNTHYKENVFGAGDAGANLVQIFLNLGSALRVNDISADKNLSLGGSLIVAVQGISLDGVGSFAPFSIQPISLSNRGKDYTTGVGIKLGGMLKLHQLSLGGSIQPRISMAKTVKYSGGFPEQGNLDIPSTGTIGLAYHVIKNLKIGLDVQWIWFSSVPAYSNPVSCKGNPAVKCFGTDDGTGFGWRNTTFYKIGIVWNALPVTILRAGYGYTTQPINAANEILFASLATATPQDHFTFGFTQWFKKNIGLSGNILYVPKKTVSGQNKLNPAQTVTVYMKQIGFGLGFDWTFS